MSKKDTSNDSVKNDSSKEQSSDIFYCPNCNNLYTDVKQNIKAQTGGVIKNGDANKNAQSETPNTVSSSVDDDNKNKKPINYGNIIKKLLNDENISEDQMRNFNVEKLTQLSLYKKLSQEQQKIVDQKINGGAMKLDSDKRYDYLFCSNCGYYEAIKPKTIMLKRTKGTIVEHDDSTRFKDMVHMSELPITRNYICSNKECKSHKNPELREAVFFRTQGSYKVRYICKTCETLVN